MYGGGGGEGEELGDIGVHSTLVGMSGPLMEQL